MRVPVRPLPALLGAGVLTAGLVVAGVVVLGGEDPAPPAAPPFTTTALSELDTDLTFPRGPFCDEIDPRQVEAALGGEPVDRRAWQNGDPVPAGDGEDVGHEFGCSYVGADGTTASAWVFAPPVDATRAAALSQLTDVGTCATSPAGFGTVGSRLSCFTDEGMSEAYRGLFGDAWLTCRVVVPIPDPESPPVDPPVDQADRWCAGVLTRTD